LVQGIIKSQLYALSVIPAQAGIQSAENGCPIETLGHDEAYCLVNVLFSDDE